MAYTQTVSNVVAPNFGDPGVNVRDFGAKGDGTTDDTTAIQNAITAAESDDTTLRAVFIPDGNYIVSGLTVARSITIRGWSDINTRLTLKAGSNRSVITYTGETAGASYDLKQPRLENLYIDGNKANNSGTSHGVYFPTVSYSVGTDYAYSAAIFQVNIVDCETSGIYVGNNRNAGSFARGSVRNCGSSGIFIGASSDWHLYHFGSGGHGLHGVYNAGGQILRIQDMDIYSNTQNGIKMDASATVMWVSGGSIDRNGQHGILLDGSGTTDRLVSILGTLFFENSSETTNTYSDITLNNWYGGSAVGTMHRRSAVADPKYLLRFAGTSGNFQMVNPIFDQTTPPYGTALTDDLMAVRLVNGSRQLDYELAVAATGTTTSDAYALTAPYTRVASGAANTGVKLPAPTYLGQRAFITNVTGNSINCYPHTGGTVNGGSVDAGAAIANGAGRMLLWNGTTWSTFVH
jgi:hypothetical protein